MLLAKPLFVITGACVRKFGLESAIPECGYHRPCLGAWRPVCSEDASGNFGIATADAEVVFLLCFVSVSVFEESIDLRAISKIRFGPPANVLNRSSCPVAAKGSLAAAFGGWISLLSGAPNNVLKYLLLSSCARVEKRVPEYRTIRNASRNCIVVRG